MPKLIIDSIEVEIEPGGTILDAARKIGADIPTMCYLDGHRAEASCMVCIVKVNGNSRLVPACATRAEEGMVVQNRTEEVLAARRTALELLFGDHLGDCVGPCQSGCPAHMDIPTMLGQIAEGRHREALITVEQHIALPAVLGRICPEICEKACRRAIQDAAVSIRLLERFVADVDLASGRPYTPDCKPPSGKKVAIVGAGPAGLAAAYYLLQEGHACEVFDDHPLPGGMLRYGVPAERLPREVLDGEIDVIRELGARFRMGERVGALTDLSREFDAVLVAAGDLSDKEAADSLGLPMAGRGLRVDAETLMTDVQGVFAAGSAVAPSQLAVRAVGSGRSAAVAIARYLRGEQARAGVRPYSIHIGRVSKDEIPVFASGASESGRVTPTGDGLREDEARGESERCLHCECRKLHSCKLREYGELYQAKPNKYRGERRRAEREISHPFVIYEPGKCISCGLCVQITSASGESLGLTFIGRGFNVRLGVPFSEPLSRALAETAKECVKACPTGALAMKDDEE